MCFTTQQSLLRKGVNGRFIEAAFAGQIVRVRITLSQAISLVSSYPDSFAVTFYHQDKTTVLS